ncbi:hypothetical protein [Colwellia psychrerythraea]|uniref:Lipoprotein n=1 Tax=Colwellia psychrerythraea TaxID=28229 RepID=A0A099L3Q5_COLPS|nr:hypothetical protein [Colwellia psychrerythraea]KGJ97065.1 hypothetical protein GAB14E_1533 [Colwellia psychrerythraea]
MKVFKIFCYLVLYVAVTACSNTEQLNLNHQSNHYYQKEFNHTEFTAHHHGSVKRAASSDQQLMISLLNRPLPEDQRMMLAFAKRQDNYFPDSTITGIRIKGEKSDKVITNRVTSHYAKTIEQDHNAVAISAMPK